MTSNSTNKPTLWFWIVGVVALVWNLLGVIAYLKQTFISDIKLVSLSKAEQALYTNVPIWATIAFAIAVFSGVLGSIALLFRKKIAIIFFIISLIGIIVQMNYSFFESKAKEVYGPMVIAIPVLIILIGIYLVTFTNRCIYRNWIS
ncbi:hypothetical protein OS188_10715 [Xanthomarina sp. F1114]|uniref:hypothetical protein n=1 Tax=Xanthomarina sp. F1114 TaxID=2996019 RepID=UPI00225E4878|nr:hypothetical protein [Xanthomarina sp. F1114]MCX7548422.1 hypothetical protein [Xanthomarina sp. F1114]